MKEEKYKINLKVLESTKNIKSTYVLLDTFCSKRGLPVHVCISKDMEPLRYLVLGTLFSAYFLSYEDLTNYLIKENMHKWTQDDELNFVEKNKKSSGVFNAICLSLNTKRASGGK